MNLSILIRINQKIIIKVTQEDILIRKIVEVTIGVIKIVDRKIGDTIILLMKEEKMDFVEIGIMIFVTINLVSFYMKSLLSVDFKIGAEIFQSVGFSIFPRQNR